MFGYTYSARLVAECLTRQGIPFEAHSPELGTMYEHGLHASFDIGEGQVIRLSIQTHPLIAGKDFAETAIHTGMQSCIGCNELGYCPGNAVLRHHDPADFYAHIQRVKDALTDSNVCKALRDLDYIDGQAVAQTSF
jgi:hypothetical protein